MAPNQGLVHLKEYDIKDSNVELIGSDIDHRVKYNSAATEPAWNDGKVGAVPGLFVWRIEDFQVVPWAKEKYGQFYDGDSYIVLHSAEVGDDANRRLIHDIFFWLGSKTSQDEAGTAAYKTVELDEFLHGVATQHRELQSSSSPEFLSLFPRFTVRSGGVQSGFRHVSNDAAAAEKKTSLLRVFKHPTVPTRGVVAYEVAPTWRSLDDGDVFVLETGDKIWVWQGKACSPTEKAKAAQIVHDMTMTSSIEVEVLSETESRASVVVSLLGGTDDTPRDGFQSPQPSLSRAPATTQQKQARLFRLSDASGALEFDLVKDGGSYSLEDFDARDVFLFDGGRAVWIWIGRDSSVGERSMWLKAAQAYIRQLGDSGIDDSHLIPVKKVVDGFEGPAFMQALET